jgi:hypothetical protein
VCAFFLFNFRPWSLLIVSRRALLDDIQGMWRSCQESAAMKHFQKTCMSCLSLYCAPTQRPLQSCPSVNSEPHLHVTCCNLIQLQESGWHMWRYLSSIYSYSSSQSTKFAKPTVCRGCLSSQGRTSLMLYFAMVNLLLHMYYEH